MKQFSIIALLIAFSVFNGAAGQKCGNQLACKGCVEEDCQWCVLKVDVMAKGQKTETAPTGLGKCVEATAGCKGIEFGQMAELLTIDTSQTGGIFSTKASVKAGTQADCVSELPTPAQSSDPKLTACPDCMKDEANEFCEFTLKADFTPGPKLQASGGACMPKDSASCDGEILMLPEIIKISTTQPKTCPVPSSTTTSTKKTTSGAFFTAGAIGSAVLAAIVGVHSLA